MNGTRNKTDVGEIFSDLTIRNSIRRTKEMSSNAPDMLNPFECCYMFVKGLINLHMYLQMYPGTWLNVGLYFELHSKIRLYYLIFFNEPNHVTLNKTYTERRILVL